MKNTDPGVALIAITVLTIEAAAILLRALLVPVVALVLTLAQWRSGPERLWSKPAAPEATTPPPAAPEAPPAKPEPHPLALLATELERLPLTALRQMVGTRSKRHTKAQLVGMIAAC